MGFVLSGVCELSAATLYVSQASTNPVPPYAAWATAATNIQDAIDAATSADTVLVTNGIYRFGGRAVGTNQLVNRVAIDRPIQVASVYGPKVTIIQGFEVPGTATGDGAIRCAYLTNGAVLSGFTLSHGATLNSGDATAEQSGGGALCEFGAATLTNCILAANTAASSGGGVQGGTVNHCLMTGNFAAHGGGACGGRLNNCLIVSNSASIDGGGTYVSSIDNCTVAFNSAAYDGGGVIHLGGDAGVETNSIIYYNSAPSYPNFLNIQPRGIDDLQFCCTTPLPGWPSSGCITNEPLFMNPVGGDFHLQAASPCIDAGTNADAAGPTDLDGSARISGGTVDMGAYEFQASGPPVITLQPRSQTVNAGSDVTFTAAATGTLPLSWQWQFNGTAIPDATNSSVTLNLVKTNDAGAYSVVVSNALGTVTSKMAALAVLPNTQVSYVWADSPSPIAPYNSWATAAHGIQQAVDSANAGSLVLVTNGTYASGGRTAGTSLVANRVAVDKPLILQSVNGPGLTVIEGLQVPGTINGIGAIRCVHLAGGATLSGFTLTNGATLQQGGDWGTEQSGGGVWCASGAATVSNCVLAGNSAAYAGGGAYGGTLVDCMLVDNQARGDNGSQNSVGGGASGAALIRCTIAGNSAAGLYGCGGGASGSSLANCTITNNSAVNNGGGVYWACTLTNCILTGNSTAGYGGGARGESGGACTLYGCVLSGNSAGSGGGASGSQLYNCTLTGNSVDHLVSSGFAYSGGGVSFCSLLNCIVYYNTAVWGDPNYDPASSLNNCCTTPLPAGGSGNISLDPQLATTSRLSANSPCRGAGLAGSGTGLDIDGEPWANPPSIGCDEYYAGAVTGPLEVSIVSSFTNAAIGSPIPFTAVIQGRASASVWDFGDGVIVSNRPYANHTWTVPGDYLVELRAYNDSQPSGVSATLAMHLPGQATHFVAAVSTNSVAPFTSWATAATNIQDAVDAAAAGDEILVGDGIYATGGHSVGTNLLVSRVAVTNLVVLRSVNGPQVTFIQGVQAPGGGNGDGAIRCVYLAKGASVFGFTLTNGATRTNGDVEMELAGGGAWCESTSAALSNCIVVANSAVFGGGVYRGTLYNCLVTSNSISGDFYGGGGAYQSTFYNCTLSGNSANASGGGGVSGATLYNSIIYYNSALFYSNYWNSSMNYCATTPTPTNGIGNAPLFVDAAKGNLRLKAVSPCINAGNNAYVATALDLDGNPRIAGVTVDIGAYEFQNPTSVISYDWLQQYGLATDGSADFIDSDGDGMNNWQEWVCGTDPTNALSVLRLLSAVSTADKVTVSWQSVPGVSYFVLRSSDMGWPWTLGPSNSQLVATNIVGTTGTNSYTDTNASGIGPFFYRVGVKAP